MGFSRNFWNCMSLTIFGSWTLSLQPLREEVKATVENDGCYSPTLRDYILMDLVNFLLLILSYLIVSDFELWGDSLQETHLSHTLHHFTNTCLPHGEPCFIKPNFILDSSFPCCAWLCCHPHAHHTCLCFSSILPLPCGCIMLLISTFSCIYLYGLYNENTMVPPCSYIDYGLCLYPLHLLCHIWRETNETTSSSLEQIQT